MNLRFYWSLTAAVALAWLAAPTNLAALELVKPKKIEPWKVKHDLSEKFSFLKFDKPQAGAGLVDPCERMVRPTDPPPMCGCPGACGSCGPKRPDLFGGLHVPHCAAPRCAPAPVGCCDPCSGGLLDLLHGWFSNGCCPTSCGGHVPSSCGR